MHNKLFFYTILAGLLTTFTAKAQPQMPGGNIMQALPDAGHIYGKLTDAATGKPLADASVMILQSKFDTATKKEKDILVRGGTTASNGSFDFESLPVKGKLTVKISVTGYEPVDKVFSFMPDGPGGAAKPQASATVSLTAPSFEKDLGTIQLNTSANQLDEIIITAAPVSKLKLDIDKKVYNVDKDVTNTGGTALDVMKNVPSVQVDIDGNVKLRNSSPQLYVDGRPTTLTLEQIPADAIESVEVITNPSAKYDASGGTAGILNVVLKKNKKTGYNGTVRVGVDSRGAINTGADLNVRQGKFNVSAGVNYNGRKGATTGTTERLNLTGVPQTLLNQSNTNTSTGGFVMGRFGVDYFANAKTTFSLSATKLQANNNIGETITTLIDSLYSGGLTSNSYQRIATGTRGFNATGLQAGYRQLFAKKGQELTADVNYFSGTNNNNSLYTTDYTGKGIEYEKVVGNGSNKFLTLQTDYINPLSSVTKLEAGVRAQIRNIVSNNETYLQGMNEAAYAKVSTATSNYTNRENVYAGYVSLSSSIKNFGYQLGLRAESSNYTGELTNTGETFSNRYAISLFPSLFLSQKLGGNQEVQASITRRINRPNFFQLIPYTDRTDKLNITVGNPDLKPEFTTSYELSYSKTYSGRNNLLLSAYYKNTTDLITRYQTTQTDAVTGTDEIITSYINASSAKTYGAEATSINYLTKWWDVTSNVNVYNSTIDASNVTGASANGMWSWFGKVNNNFKLPNNFTFQLSGSYQSKTNLPVNSSSREQGPSMGQAQSAAQGYIKAFYALDAGIKKTFLKDNAASVTLSISDILGTRKQVQYSSSDYFTQTYSRLNNPQLVRLTFGYRFGKLENLFKKKDKSDATQSATEGMNL